MNTKPYIDRMCSYIEANNYAGYDPYDALNSPVLRALSCGRKYGRIAVIQLLKKLPVNLRPILGIRNDHNPKGIGLFLWGYAKLYKIEKKPEYLEQIDYLLSLLDRLQSRGYSGNCWGYNFDWQSRAFFVPKYTPTIVNSSFIGHALIDTYIITSNKKALELAIPIKDFILTDLNRHHENSAQCFSYTPLDHTWIHNANLLGASLLIRLHGYTSDEELKQNALAALDYAMKYQHPDGSWYYGEQRRQNWIDSFHTGFNLQSLWYFLQEGYAKEFESRFWKGVEFYVINHFLSDGTPKYYHNRTYPIDVHAPSQALVFFSLLGSKYSVLTQLIANWMLKNLYDRKGYFYYQKTKWYTNTIPYMRWSQAWAFHGLTTYMIANHDSEHVAI
ncbi:MAG: delta-aminolevulinic acid dehydratase [Calditrichaeota bacterium]|nr:delta-aminolevulinic acid dehydratase [Calditrichota bacterium]